MSEPSIDIGNITPRGRLKYFVLTSNSIENSYKKLIY